jgi:hypothetical protein
MMKNLNSLTREELESLPPDELLEIIQMAETLEGQNAKVREYIPNIVQQRVHSSKAFIRALFSGNGVGKTTACIQEGIWVATGTHPTRETARIPNTTIIVLDDSSKADTVYMRNIRKYKWYDITKLTLEKHGRSYTQEVKFPNGSNWIFMTHEMAEDKWESIECACVIFDEPPPRFIFIALLRGMREKDMRPWIMFAGTPRGRHAPWMYKYIYKPWKLGQDDEIECFFGATDDNLHNLDPDTIKRWEKRYSKSELETRRKGSFEFLSGRIFDTFSNEHHVIRDFPFPKNWKCIIAVDPHLRKNHTAVILGVNPDGEIYAVRELQTSLAGRRAAEFFILACEQFNVVAGVCDNFGSIELYNDGDSEERKSFIKIWNEQALRMRRPKLSLRATTRAEKNDAEWIEDMKDWLRLDPDHEGNMRPKFFVFESLVNLVNDFETYIWDEHTGRKASTMGETDPKETPLGTNQDFLMCVKYGLAAKPQNIGVAKVISHKQIHGRCQEYESRPRQQDWRKD